MTHYDKRKLLREAREMREKSSFTKPGKTAEGMLHGGIDEELAIEDIRMLNYPKLTQSGGEFERYKIWPRTIRDSPDFEDLKYAYLRKKKSKKSDVKRKTKRKHK